jgi:hypothetical protein
MRPAGAAEPSPARTRRVHGLDPGTHALISDAIGASAAPAPSPARLWRPICGLGLGIVLGSFAAFMLSPSILSARDDGVFELIHSDSRVRTRPATRSLAPAVAPTAYWSAPQLPAALPYGAALGPAPGREPRQARRSGTRTASTAAGTRSVCVRMCDGFHFPIGEVRGEADLKAHEALCTASCPSAPVRLFTLAPGQDEIEAAIGRDGRRYADLPMALAYRQGIDTRACLCAKPGQSLASRIPIRADFTLRPGDAVVTTTGARVFVGGKRLPWREASFQDFRKAKVLSKNQRAGIDTLLGVSRRQEAARQWRREARVRVHQVLAQAPASPYVMTDLSIGTSAGGVRVIGGPLLR